MNSALDTSRRPALNAGSLASSEPYSLSQPYVSSLPALPRWMVQASTGSHSLVGAAPCAGQLAQSFRSSAVNSASCRNSSSGICRMITDEVSRWIRSCSIPMRMIQAGVSWRIGSSSGIDWMKSSTRALTAAR